MYWEHMQTGQSAGLHEARTGVITCVTKCFFPLDRGPIGLTKLSRYLIMNTGEAAEGSL